MGLVNLKMSKEDRKNYLEPSNVEAPQYPWGMELNLDKDVIEKLGLGNAGAGDEVTMVCKCKVTNKSESDGERGSHHSLTLQITDAQAEVQGKEEQTTEDFLKGVLK